MQDDWFYVFSSVWGFLVLLVLAGAIQGLHQTDTRRMMSSEYVVTPAVFLSSPFCIFLIFYQGAIRTPSHRTL
jgi:hypothetical protein